MHGLGEFYEKGKSRDTRSIYHEIEEQINDLKEEIEELEIQGGDTTELTNEMKYARERYFGEREKHAEILDKIAKELEDNANKYGFHSFSTIPVRFKEGESVETVTNKINEELEKEWTFLHKNFYLQNKNNEEFEGPMGIGPGKVNTETGKFSGRNLREHLESVKINPEYSIYRKIESKGKLVPAQIYVSDYYF